MQTNQRTIAGPGSHEIVVKKSRFICSVNRAASESAARDVIEETRRRFWDASHNCSAYRIGPGGQLQRSNDDGEPAGTAGTPMLDVLTKRDLTDTVAVVSRYFGGTLLGAGGLTRAYGHAVSAAIDAVGIIERRPVAIVVVEATHADAGRLEHAVRTRNYRIGAIAHGATVTFELFLPHPTMSDFAIWLAGTTNGRSHAVTTGQTFDEVRIDSASGSSAGS